MTALSTATVLVRSKEPLAARVDDEIVMLDSRQSAYFGLDGAGVVIWELLDEPLSIEAVCAHLIQEYDVDLDTCRRDVLAFAAELVDAGLVEVRRAPT